MNTTFRKSCLAIAAVLMATAALAHHSAVQFDFAKQVPTPAR